MCVVCVCCVWCVCVCVCVCVCARARARARARVNVISLEDTYMTDVVKMDTQEEYAIYTFTMNAKNRQIVV